MTDYTELVKALRCETSNGGECWEKKCQYLVCGSYAYCNAKRIMADAAAAIEALIGTVGDLQAIRERLEEENDALRLEPKRGEWIDRYDEDDKPFFKRKYVCSACGGWNTYGKSKYCPKCGAKMEVQE